MKRKTYGVSHNPAPTQSSASTLLLTLGFPPAVGGIQSLLWRRAMLGGKQMIVIAPQSASRSKDRGQQIQPRFDQLLRWHTPFDRTPGLKRLSQLLAPLALAWPLCGRGQVNRLEVGQALPFGVAALLLKRRFGLPYAVWTYGDDLLKPIASSVWRPWLRLCLRHAQTVYACSHWTADLAIRAGAQASQVEVVYPWAAPHFFASSSFVRNSSTKASDSQSVFRLLTVARIEQRKGIHVILDALPHVIPVLPQIRYEIVGEGAYLPALQHLVNQLGLADVVHFAGAVPDHELPHYYAVADLFMLTPTPNLACGENEGFGLVYGEAAACHKPSVALRCGGVPEAVLHDETGLLAHQPDPQEVAQLVLRLARDDAMRQRMGEAAYRLACQRAAAAQQRFGEQGR